MTAPTQDPRAGAMLDLLARARLADSESAQRISQAKDLDFWREMNPDLSVERHQSAEWMQDGDVDESQHETIVVRLRSEGWLGTPPLLAPAVTAAMRKAIERLREKHWPEAFAFAYDEFWLAPRVPALARIIEARLGPGYRQLPHIWGHYVPPGSSGWSPHTDGFGTDRLTIWFALNHATLENSCMYVIPAHRTPPEIASNFPSIESVDRRQLYTLLQHARALPAPPGAALGWHHHVIHWGAPSYQTTEPRISFSQEFIAAGASPTKSEVPLLDSTGPLPSLTERLRLIATAVLAYQRFEPMMTRYTDLANGLI